MNEFLDDPNLSDYRDFARRNDEYYETASARLSRENESALREMKDRVESSAIWTPDVYSMLALKSDTDMSGHTLPFHGIINVHPKFFSPEAQKVGFAVSAHERAHLHTGGALRREVFKDQPTVDRHFHEVVIPLWRSGNISIPLDDQDFRLEKRWTSLYPEWSGLRVEFDEAAKALKRYYWLLERGFLRTEKEGDLSSYQMNPDNPRDRELLKRREPVSIQQQFEDDPQKYLKMAVTGYAFGNYLSQNQRDHVGRDAKRDLWETEESFANFVGMEIAGMSKEELKAAVRQDEGKYFLVDKFRAKYHGRIDELLAHTVDYQRFAEVLKGLQPF